MAWETRHVKVQFLNDSRYVGICVYCALSTSIVVVLSSLVTERVLFNYLATTISILISTTIGLILLFIPKIRMTLKRIDVTEDPIMQSMGLKIESNTRRFVIDDTKEMLFRMQVQNKVYKAEVEALDREIERLECLLNGYPTTFESRPYIIVDSSTINRASWPNCKNSFTVTSSKFLSERKLTKNVNSETLVDKLKKIF